MTRQFTWKGNSHGKKIEWPIMIVVHPHEQGNENLNPGESPFYTY